MDNAVFVLVDYSNLDALERSRGIGSVIEHISRCVGHHIFIKFNRLIFRLYGGWFSGNILSKDAQNLVPELSNFPIALTIDTGSSPYRTSIIVEASLADQFIFLPGQQVKHTFREKGVPPRLACRKLPLDICIDQFSCSLKVVESFINNGRCPFPGCDVSPKTLFYRREQKLVDTMMTVDLIYLAQQKHTPIVLVSDDDDFWPGISFVTNTGINLIHVQSKTRISLVDYSNLLGSGYIKIPY